MNEAEWEATETENIFFFADHSYAIPRKFLTVTDDFYVQRYSLESDGHVYFKNIGDGGKKQVITDPYQFSGITVGETDTAKGVAEIEKNSSNRVKLSNQQTLNNAMLSPVILTKILLFLLVPVAVRPEPWFVGWLTSIW